MANDADGVYSYPGDPDEEAFRELFAALRTWLIRKDTDDDVDDSVALKIWRANQELISLMPEAGRRDLESLYKKRVEQI